MTRDLKYKTMVDKKYIPNDNTQNSDHQLNEPTNQNIIIVTNVVDLTNKKTFGTSVINRPMSPPSPGE